MDQETNTQKKMQMWTVVIADDEPIIRFNLKEMLEHLGYTVLACVEDGFDAIEACKTYKPDIVLLDIKMPVLDGLAAAHYISENNLAETIMILTAYHDISLVERANDAGVAGYLVKPISENALMPYIAVAQARSKEIGKLRNEVKKAKQEVEARKIIEKAKGVIMERKKLNEQDAYHYIRKISKERSISMQTVAEMLLRNS
jgi:response regulator NasT